MTKHTIKLADHHCHILKKYYENPIQEVLKLKGDTELRYIWSMGLDLDTSLEGLEYKKELNDEFFKIGFGFHPSDIIEKAKTLGKDVVLLEFEKLKNLIIENQSLIDIVGEIGLDFSYPNSRDYEDLQIKIFAEFLKLSKEFSKPVSIHCRDAWKEMMKVIGNEEYSGFLHSFTGTFEQGMFCIEAGLKLGLNGIITFKRSEELRDAVRSLLEFYADKEFDELFGLETDAPYLSPEPIRHEKTNSPKNVVLIKDFIENHMLNKH